MWLDGVHMSTSVASFEFEPIDEGTRFTHVEHGVFFDQFWADGTEPRGRQPGPPRGPGQPPRMILTRAG